MSEYACKECQENCRASANKKPIYCLYSGVDRARWKEVTLDTPPKLTAEELAKRGIEWPEEADGAIVHSDGHASFYYGKDIHVFYPCGHNPDWYVDMPGGGFIEIPGKWDASDWKNSLIRRPEKKLYEFIKKGAWVYWKGDRSLGFSSTYLCVSGMGANGILSFSNIPSLDGIHITEIQEARLRPWTSEEMKQKVGKIFDAEKDSYLAISFRDGKLMLATGCNPTFYTAETLISIGFTLDNSPCGVLEHREGEGWVR